MHHLWLLKFLTIASLAGILVYVDTVWTVNYDYILIFFNNAHFPTLKILLTNFLFLFFLVILYISKGIFFSDFVSWSYSHPNYLFIFFLDWLVRNKTCNELLLYEATGRPRTTKA